MRQVSLAMYRYLWAVLVLSIVIFSCDTSTPEPFVPEYLLASSLEIEHGAGNVKLLAESFGFSSLASNVQYDLELYSIEYATELNGFPIEASGLVGIPVGATGDLPVVSIQHGTITAFHEAPTALPASYLVFASLASAGYVVVIPDFVGFGSSEQFLHPYYVKEEMAQTVIDMIRAGKEFATTKGIMPNNHLFLLGYSEGGYATLVAHQAIQEAGEADLQVTASAPASGGYDTKHLQEHFFSQETYHQPYYMPYVTLAYQEYLDADLDLNEIFQEPYASIIPDLYDGSKVGSQINNQLTDTIEHLFTKDILDNFDTDVNYADFRNKLIANGITDFVPTSPVRLYHGTDDMTIPISNTDVTYQKMLDAGASPAMVQLIALPGATHSSGLLPYAQSVIPWIISFTP